MRRAVALILGVSCALPGAGCCSHRVAQASRQIRDRLEVYATVGFDTPARCAVPPSQRVSRLAGVAESVPVWVRIGQADDLKQPAIGRVVRLSVVDEFGDPVPRSAASVTPETTLTGYLGVAQLLTFVANQPGIYRIRAEYRDRHVSAFSYSTTLVVDGSTRSAME